MLLKRAARRRKKPNLSPILDSPFSNGESIRRLQNSLNRRCALVGRLVTKAVRQRRSSNWVCSINLSASIRKHWKLSAAPKDISKRNDAMSKRIDDLIANLYLDMGELAKS